MKKFGFNSPNGNRYVVLKKGLIVMKITLILILISTLNLLATGTYSQTARVSLKLNQTSIKQVLKEIEHSTEFYFLYNNDLVNVERKVDIDADNEQITNILDRLFANGEEKYAVYDRQIVISPANMPLPQEAQRKVAGKVTDQSGAPITGASVVVKGTTIGVTTGYDGTFTLVLPTNVKSLTFSFVGMKTQEVPIGAKSQYNVILQEETIGLEEVVAVGYGTQKKANLTGSVAAVSGDELVKRPAPNVQNLLQGKVTGLQVTEAYGKPGDEGNVMRIRGIGTFSSAGSNPLVLIDGISGDMTNLNPNDIASISVLKDAASSAIYGARAANGVILITTKRGTSTEGLNITYDGNVQAQSATRLPDLVTNSADYMTYWNQARVRNGMTGYFTPSTIDAFRNNQNDPVHYPNFDWIHYMFHTAFTQDHHINISGGNDKTTFNMSLGYMDQGGIVSIYDFKKYTALISVDTKVKDWITIGGAMTMVKKDIAKNNFDSTGDDYVLGIYGSGPNYNPMVTLPDGTSGYVARYSAAIGEWTVRNPKAQDVCGEYFSNAYNISPQFYAKVKLHKNLEWMTKGSLILDEFFSKNHEHAVNNYYFDNGAFAHNNSTWHLGAQDSWAQNMLTTFYSTLSYNKVFNQSHTLSALAGYNQEYNNNRVLGGTRVTFPTDGLRELNAASATNQTTSGTSYEWAIRSYFGRINYDFKGKYLVEVNGRYDGTSRIASNTRWGFFPSVSAAWRVTQESFAKKYDWLTNLKVRGSWGQLGNQNVGNYPYQEVLSTTSYPFDTNAPGAYQARMVDKTLKWETTTITDAGVDLDIKSGLFTLTADWYNKNTTNILYTPPVPYSVGLSAPTVNYGSMTNKGIDLEIGHEKQVGEFKYRVTLNYSSFRNEVTKIISPTYGIQTVQVGIPWNSYYLIKQIGIFQNQSEITSGPTHPFNPKPGDLKFQDQLTIDTNGDGIMDKADNVIDSKDRVVVPGAYPKFYGGGSINIFWRDFDLTAFFQGVWGQKFYNTGGWGSLPFMQGSAPTKKFVSEMWTGEGTSNTQPAMFMNGYAPVTGTNSTFLLYDASYLRLKNLAIGYNLPKKVYEKIGLKGLRVYVSGDNLLTFTKYPEADPERAVQQGRFAGYPQLMTLTLGIRVKL